MNCKKKTCNIYSTTIEVEVKPSQHISIKYLISYFEYYATTKPKKRFGFITLFFLTKHKYDYFISK